jgi:hypothetical protein
MSSRRTPDAPGAPAPLPPWLTGAGAARGSSRPPLRALRAPALVLAGGMLGWMLHAWREPAPVPPPPAPVVQAPVCPDLAPCGGGGPASAAAGPSGHARTKTPLRPLSLHPLPAEGASEDTRREALRAFAEQKAGDLRSCLQGPARGPLRRVGAALEIDAHGTVAAVQILGGDTGSRALESCYSARLRSWRFPQALLQGDQRLLVNFVL